MPKLVRQLPKYALHKASGQAIVKFHGKTHYLGPHDSKPSKREYKRLMAKYVAADDPLEVAICQPEVELTIVEMLARFCRFAAKHYRKHGKPTRSLGNIEDAIRPLKMLYGKSLVKDFGPLALKKVRDQMVNGYTDPKGRAFAGLSRNVINSRIQKIKLVFGWAVSEQIAPPSLGHALAEVKGLQAGRSDARETSPIQPVPDAVVEATIEHLPKTVADMVRLQRLTGCRPGEVCSMRPAEIDRSDEVWVYKPESHKTQHHGRERLIFIGPQAQAILSPYLLRDSVGYCFSPDDSERKRHAAMRDARQTPVQPSQQNRRKRRPRLVPTDRYDKNSYRRAIKRACKKAGVGSWSPNRLRHTAATQIRKRFGLEASQVVLGHSNARTTEIYAERDSTLGVQVAMQIG